MKRYSLYLVVLLFLNLGCKKSGSESVDPRDNYVGTYDVAYTYSTMIGSFVYEEKKTGSGTLTISKAEDPSNLRYNYVWGQQTETMDVKLDGSKFTVLRQKDMLVIQSRNFSADYAGSGEFKGANMNLVAIIQATSSDGSKLVKNVVYNAVKK